MYIAGLNLPFTACQGVEALVVLSTVEYFRFLAVQTKEITSISASRGGHIRPESMPTLLSQIISPIHGLAIAVPPMVYVGAVVVCGFQQPEWLNKFSLPDVVMGVSLDETVRNVARVLACVGSLALKRLMRSTFEHLSDQWHTIGRRENPRVVQTGPYAWVRHPGYSSVLIQQGLWSIAFWSYIPLYALGLTAALFAIKMPIEENLIQQDEGIKEEYTAYMKKVPARIIPRVW